MKLIIFLDGVVTGTETILGILGRISPTVIK
jgi:hypothetical protein